MSLLDAKQTREAKLEIKKTHHIKN